MGKKKGLDGAFKGLDKVSGDLDKKLAARSKAADEWIGEHIPWQYRALAGVVALAAALLGGWWALAYLQLVAPFPTIDWWAVGLTAVLLAELRLIWRAMLPAAPLEAAPSPWWEEHTMLHAMHHAGILKSLVDESGVPLTLDRIAGPVTTDDGALGVGYRMPRVPGLHSAEATKRQDALAAALRLPTARFTVSEYDGIGDQIWCALDPELPPLPVMPPPELREGHCWSDPWRIGRTMRGRPFHELIWDTAGFLFGGRPKYGKTLTLRLLVRHYLADPKTQCYGFDGKNSATDYPTVLRDLFHRWIEHEFDERDTIAALFAMLDEALTEVRRRQRVTDRKSLPGMLVMVEEWSLLRDAMSDDQAKELDRKLRQIARQGRQYNVLVATTSQRPSAKTMDTDLRDLFKGITARAGHEGAKMALGDYDDRAMSLPQGYVLVGQDEGERNAKVIVDYLDDQAWHAWLTRLAIARRPLMTLVPGPQDDVQDAPVTAESEYRRIVTEDMPLTTMWEALSPDLPLDVRRASAAAFARWELEKIGVTKANGLWWRTDECSWVSPMPPAMPPAADVGMVASTR